jgi:transcriptional regulator with XRE-family HTH domain
MKLQTFLRQAGKTYRSFAAEAGFDPAQVHRWASGKRSPSLAQIARITQATGGQVTAQDFMATEAGKAA